MLLLPLLKLLRRSNWANFFGKWWRSDFDYLQSLLEQGKKHFVNILLHHFCIFNKSILNCLNLMFQPGGSLVITTINQTVLSYAAAIVGAEYILRLVTPGTHDWNKFVSVDDLSSLISRSMWIRHQCHEINSDIIMITENQNSSTSDLCSILHVWVWLINCQK